MKLIKTIGIFLFVMVLFVGCHQSKLLTKVNQKEVMENKEAVMAFYNKALTVNNETRPTQVLTPLLAEDYKSFSSVGSKGAEELMGQLEFFWKLIPDLKWEPKEIINEGNVFVVRSSVTGTPDGNFMGTPTDGSKTISIMTMDMHTMKDGKFISTHHVEDWTTAMGQLKRPDQGAETVKIANAYMKAMGKGDMEAMMGMMHEDMVWQNAGDGTLPWIGPWNGKKAILEVFLPSFSKNFQTIKWEPNDVLSNDDTAAYFGQMVGLLTNSDKKTKEFTYALRVKVKDGKIILWNWFEDSFEVSRAYHAK